MPSVLPFVSQPSPRDGAYGITAKQLDVTWVPSRNAGTSIAYFSKDANPEQVAIQSERSFKVGALEQGTRYYWRIDEIVGKDTVKGPTWHFTTN